MKNRQSSIALVRTCAIALALIALGLSGCSDNGLIKISGTVTFDGEPIPEGSISFMPVDGKGVTAGGEIKNGKYTAEVSPGEMAVQIYASKEMKKENPTQEEIERGITSDPVQYIPEEYNKASTLRITVADSGGKHDFDLKASPEKAE